MNSRFPILSGLSAILRVVGRLLLLAGGWLLLGWLDSSLLPDPLKALGRFSGLIGVVLLANGFGALVVGELIGVVFAIEENTRNFAPPAASKEASTKAPSPSESENPSYRPTHTSNKP